MMESFTSCFVCSGIRLGSKSKGAADKLPPAAAPKLSCCEATAGFCCCCCPPWEAGVKKPNDAPCWVEDALCSGPMRRSGVFCFVVALERVGASVRRSSPGTEVEVDEEGAGAESSEMRLLLLGCLELDAERGGWEEGDLRPLDGRGTDIT